MLEFKHNAQLKRVLKGIKALMKKKQRNRNVMHENVTVNTNNNYLDKRKEKL